MRRLKAKWQAKGFGWKLDKEHKKLTNLRFADDVMVLGTSLSQVAEMLDDLILEAAGVGLEVHLGKTSILSNGMDSDKEIRKTEIRGIEIDVLEAGKQRCILAELCH